MAPEAYNLCLEDTHAAIVYGRGHRSLGESDWMYIICRYAVNWLLRKIEVKFFESSSIFLAMCLLKATVTTLRILSYEYQH